MYHVFELGQEMTRRGWVNTRKEVAAHDDYQSARHDAKTRQIFGNFEGKKYIVKKM